MLKGLRWVFVWGVASMLAMSCLAKVKSSGNKRHQFFLMSTYTKDDAEISRDEFSKLHQRIVKKGIVVYRNGQTYSVLVPLKNIYKKGTSNYKDDGKEAVKDLADFLGFYDVEYMQFTGMVFRPEQVKEKSDKGLKTSYNGAGKEDKKLSSDLKRKNRTLRPELVSLKQTSDMVREMRRVNKSFAGIAVSITEEVDRNQELMHGLAIAVNDQIMDTNNKIEAAATVIQEVVTGKEDLGVYEDGGILIEFKKY